ncbi:MAG: ATP-binding cassette domain-containing protein [Actinobacteria bacterium]|nr:ATP-binding cassette domain-containing protein [Actinomycetota bacterium]
MENLLARRTAELSGGELQRVALAAALAPRPRVLALDEPTAQLDPVAAAEFFDAVDIANDSGTAVVIAEHRLDRALARADRVLALDAGEIAFDGAPSAFLDWALADGRGAALVPAGARPYPRAPRPAVPASTRPVLEFTSVDYTHPGAECLALREVSIELHAGERVALMGENGSGKSTLLRLARGLVQPASGSVRAAGDVGLLLQNPNDYLIHERVADEAPAVALERFGLTSHAERDPRDLSGGERQRLALAIVMQSRPVVLLLDEPTRGMDRERKLDLLAQLDDIAAAGTAVVLATHDQALAAAFADRVITLAAGTVEVLDSPDEVDSPPRAAVEAVA